MAGLRGLWRRRPTAVERRYFDDAFYRASYLDVAATNIDGFSHYMSHGWLEGRNPSEGFVTLYYRDCHLKGQRVNPLTHYAMTGKKQSLRTAPENEASYISVQVPLVRPFFSEMFYRTQNIEVTGDLLQHYLCVGWREHIAPSHNFDVAQYISQNAFIDGLDVSPLYHFASQHRLYSHRNTHETEAFRQLHKTNMIRDSIIRQRIAEEFDREYYLYENSDVRDANVDPLDHFIEYGWREQRKPNKYFDCGYYLAENPEVAQTGVNPLYHFLAIGRSKGLRPNPVGLNYYPAMKAPSETDWQHIPSASDAESAECILIMPVYKGAGETLASIHSILTAPQRTPYALFVVDDCSPDKDLVAALRTLAARGLLQLETNTANLGFIASVNSGLRRFPDKNVVLVNADTKVFGDWLDRLLAHARRDPTIATITPFSNNATVASYPVRSENNMFEMETDAAGLDRLAAVCNAGRASDLPVGVGFCLFMSAASRAAVGLLDEETFGRGYGDENDFCLRAARAGLRNVLAEDVFVYHVGEVSFGAPQQKRSRRGEKALVAKHPDYPSLLSLHHHADPTEEGRIRLDLMRLSVEAGPAPVVQVYHALGGGIATHVQQEVQKLQALGRKVVVLRVGVGDRWSVEIRSGWFDAPYCPNLRPLPIIQFRSLLLEFVGWLSPEVIHIHSFVGLEWRATTTFFDLLREARAPYTFMLHDYSVVCHRNTLVRPTGRYCGLPNVETCQQCVAGDRSYPEAVDPAVRREAYGHFLEGATQVFAPSRDIKSRLEAAGARYAIEVRPHEEAPIRAPALKAPENPEKFKIVTLGAISLDKGSRVILSLARDAKARNLPICYHIVGYSDIPTEMEAAGAIETGRYMELNEAFAQVAAIEPSCIFLPSIWPETYCYTLSLALELRCLPVVFDIGAQAERVREKRFGVVLPYELLYNIKALNNRFLEMHDLAAVSAISCDPAF